MGVNSNSSRPAIVEKKELNRNKTKLGRTAVVVPEQYINDIKNIEIREFDFRVNSNKVIIDNAKSTIE